ncbi:hypothetical protein [Agromyces sp. ZXT2-6]|uniref:hypothetical protein n=1 Tax=Agromyces sp. ZXT2-6 TaxID=3461153 RepID=UPI0040552B2B
MDRGPGGDGVTFNEVGEIVGGLDDGSLRVDKLGSDVSAYLDAAEAASDAGGHAGAIAVLRQAQAKANGLQDGVLVAKIGDLIEWQQGLAS